MSNIGERLLKAAEICERMPNTTIEGDFASFAFSTLLREAAVVVQEWQTGDPPMHGYYLGAWRRGTKIVVSELWFNPDANSRWWFTRAYTVQHVRAGRDLAVTAEVVAWMPLPKAPA